MLHRLKTLTKFWGAVYRGEKTFELRKNDRNFAVGDTLCLIEYPGDRELTVTVIYLLPGGQYGLDPEYVILGVRA